MSNPHRKTTTRAIVISDLHLGGIEPHMMSNPGALASFIHRLPTILSSDETLELIIAGDFVDFLAISPQASWTPDPIEATNKLKRTMQNSPFSPVFQALGTVVSKGIRLTILVGNHDVELALPPVQRALLDQIGGTPYQIRFIDDGRAYQIGKVLIEHGNRYDNANRNDWQGIRAIASSLSRYEDEPEDRLKVSAGSRIVERVINGLKSDYPFIDLLQPQGEVVAYLLAAFEPELKWQWDTIVWILRGRYLENQNKLGVQPGESRYIASVPLDMEDRELQEAFGELYDKMKTPTQRDIAGLGGLLDIVLQTTKESLSQLLKDNRAIPPERLQQIRVALRKLLLDEKFVERDGPTRQYGSAATRLIADSRGQIEVVIMGHTHLARHIGPPEKATYINTGTWADIIRVPTPVLEDGADEALTQFLKDLLKKDKGRVLMPTYADLRIAADGNVMQAQLCSYDFHAIDPHASA